MGPKVELRGEDVIQAVVVADSFSSAFAPLTLSAPGCLLPLAGRPLLEYTLEVRE
jgi:translation initiation factor eIF-2B subunit epsilon